MQPRSAAPAFLESCATHEHNDARCEKVPDSRRIDAAPRPDRSDGPRAAVLSRPESGPVGQPSLHRPGEPLLADAGRAPRRPPPHPGDGEPDAERRSEDRQPNPTTVGEG